MKKIILIVFLACFISCKNSINTTPLKEITKPEDTEVWGNEPPEVRPGKTGSSAPSDAIILFDGSNFNEWVSENDGSDVQWILNSNGSMTVNDQTGHIITKRNFGSIQLHLEWKSPTEILADGQNRGNSGVFLQGRYEVQILDNNDNKTYINGMVGSLYKQSIPLAKAVNPTGIWNTYDIIFHAPEFDLKGNVTKKATVTVLLNNILIQDNFEILGPIKYIGLPKYEPHGKAPLMLQDHGDNSRVSFRNIWVREL